MKITICGRSNIVGMPLFLLLNRNNAGCVSMCHSGTPDLIDTYLKPADIVITAIGKPKYFKGSWLKEGVIVIDVGINEYMEINELTGESMRKVCGDVDFESVAPVSSYITPVPGGVGPMTIAMLIQNVYKSWERKI